MKRRTLKRGWLGDTVSYVYLTVLAVCAAFPPGVDPAVLRKGEGRNYR